MRASRAVYTPLSLSFAVYLFIAKHERMGASLSGLTPAMVAAIFIIIAVAHVFITLSSHLLFLSAGQTPTYRLVFCTHFNRLPARYLPGGIWQAVSRALDFSANGLPRRTIIQVVALEVGLAVSLTGMIGSILLLFGADPPHPALLWLGTVAGAVGIAVMPYLTGALGNDTVQLRLREYAGSVGAFAVVCLLYGSAFHLFVGQVLPVVAWGQAAGVFLVSWLAGFLAVFAPQGIGVFEVTAGYLLTGSLATGIVASMFAFRALSVASDLGVWLIFRLWLWIRGPHACGSSATSP